MAYCKFHNVRFYNLEPKAISCMVYDPNSKKLALSRHDASIEIWGLSYSPYLERTIQGHADNSVEALGWVDGRLLSTGLGGFLVEWNVKSLDVAMSVSVTGNAAWCLDINKQETYVAVGTEQGYLNVFSLKNNTLLYERIMDKQEGRILCCKYDSTGDFIVTGSIDALRIWNVKTGHAVHKMSTGRSETNKETIVWCLEITDNFTILSGDSRGKLTFWNGHIGSQIESFASHKADILTLCLSEDQKSIYCAGVDPTITHFSYISVRKGEKGDVYKWFKSIERKIHDHDVRALALCGDKLFSGGIDGYLAVSSYPPKFLHKYPPLLQNPCVTVCSQARLLLLRYTSYLEVWRLGKAKDEVGANVKSGVVELQQMPAKLLEMRSRNDEGIICSEMSSNGKWLSYSTDNSLRLYTFCIQENAPPRLSKVTALPQDCPPALHMVFYPNNNCMVLASRSKSLVVLSLDEEIPSVIQIIDLNKTFRDTVHKLQISPCGKYLVAGALCGGIVVWNLKKDIWNQHCILPRYKCPATAIGIQLTPVYLVAVYSDHKLIEYDIQSRTYTPFSVGLDERLPLQWLNRAMPVSHITFDSRNKCLIILTDDTTVWTIDKSKELPNSDVKIPRLDTDSLDGRPPIASHPFTVLKKYKHLVHLGSLGVDEIVAVEVNALSLTEQLPPPLSKKYFGAM